MEIVQDSTAVVQIKGGLVATVDACDLGIVDGIRWRQHRGKCGLVYAVAHLQGGPYFMHWVIAGKPPKGKFIDHRNTNGLDNRRENLRICTRTQNTWNREKKQFGTSSRFKGVHWRAHCQLWDARIQCFKVRYALGYFKDEISAAMAYDAAAVKYFGEFARLNFP